MSTSFLRHTFVPRNIMLLGLLMFGTGSILAGEVFPIDIEKIAGGDFLYWRISSLIRDIGIILVSGIMIISGFKDVRTKGRSPAGILRISSGILICLVLIILCFYVRSVLIKVRTSFFTEDAMNRIESVLADNYLPDKNRRYWEKARAKEYYLRYGKFLEYTTEQGEKKIYQPTQEDIEFKNKYDSTYSLTGWIISTLSNAMVLWASVLVFSMLIGLFLPVRKPVNMNET